MLAGTPGPTGTYSFKFIVDITQPTLNLDSGYTNQNPMPISGTYYDRNIWYIDIKGDSILSANSTVSYPNFNAAVQLIDQTNGDKLLTATAVDKGGNTALDTATYVYDSLAPYFENIQITGENVYCISEPNLPPGLAIPPDADCITGGTGESYKEITISGGVSEKSDLVIIVTKTTGTQSTLTYTIANRDITYNDLDNSFEAVVRLPYNELENYYDISLVATDLAGNINPPENRVIYLERIPPGIVLQQPTVIYLDKTPPEAFTNNFITGNQQPILITTSEYADCSIILFALNNAPMTADANHFSHSTGVDLVIGEGPFRQCCTGKL